ncbi:DUF397 domain-containing protein [Trebonia sp.]|uniref:DUF397 domain-containing protein n=1 Tax=Trebonia sp. TaxID=2767075 RepID=UPI002601656A|nr:DUF397 domain-containing protein [Trebonia sp.]
MTWRKSTYSGGNGGNCVEVGQNADCFLVRDTKDRAGAMLAFSAQAWRRFAAMVRDSAEA